MRRLAKTVALVADVVPAEVAQVTRCLPWWQKAQSAGWTHRAWVVTVVAAAAVA